MVIKEIWVRQLGQRWLWQLVVLLGFVVLGTCTTQVALAAKLAPNNDDEIVYLDPDGFIKVFDPSPPAVGLSVDWSSPEGGWNRLALADFNGDGDAEIVAIRSEGNGGRLVIFDPVVSDAPENHQLETINDVPWEILFELELPRPPVLLTTGSFDLGRRGDEILYSYSIAGDDRDRFVVLRQEPPVGSGREWEEQLSWELDESWNAVATGNIDTDLDAETDEVALTSYDRGTLRVYRIEPSVTMVFENVNPNHRWQNVAFGQFETGGGMELGAVRDADVPLASVWIFRYDGTKMVDHLSIQLSPSPNVLFFADIGNNGDDELAVLRQVRQELGPRARLVLRDNANDTLNFTEQLLDGDNEYQGGAAGDIDADGRDELVLIRNNRIRIYASPESSQTYREILRNTNRKMVQLGNVDAAGLAQFPELSASPLILRQRLQPGQQGSAQVVIVQDAVTGASLPFTTIVQGAEGWATVVQSSNVTSATLSVTFSAVDLQPGDYEGRIVVDAQAAGVRNDPLGIDLLLTVERVITSVPASVDFVYFPCEEALSIRSQRVALQGRGAVAYTARIEGAPSWVTVAPEGGTLPESVTITVDPNLRPADINNVDLLVTVEMPTIDDDGIINRVPISLICAADRVLAPVVSK